MSGNERTKLFQQKTHKYGSGAKEVDAVYFVTHEVKPTDTLAGLAIKYGVQKEQIMHANKLFSADSMFSRKTLRIPVTTDPHAEGGEGGGESATDDIVAAGAADGRAKSPEKPASQINDILARTDKVLATTMAEVERRDHKLGHVEDYSTRVNAASAAPRLAPTNPTPTKLKTVTAFGAPFGKSVAARYNSDNEGLLDEADHLFEL